MSNRHPLPTISAFVQQPRGPNLLWAPLRVFFRWRYARFVLQLPLLILALFVIIDGLSGRQLAPRNVATVSVWLHYRGLVIIALALIGNAFCAACPLMLTRGLTKRLAAILPTYKWPRALKNKWLVMGLLALFFFSYEYWNLWASPWLTAWLAIGYFLGALLIDTFFPVGTFCKYVCPLGNFNFLYASASPTQITAINPDVCRDCHGKPCLYGRVTEAKAPPITTAPHAVQLPLANITHPNGKGFFPGCETGLFVPTMQSNRDCTLCFNCVRACPYDNVALTLRAPTWEWQRLPRKGHFSFIVLGLLLTYFGLINAIAMVPQYYHLADTLRNQLGLMNTAYQQAELIVLGLFFGAAILIGIGITSLTALLADAVGAGKPLQLRRALLRWGSVTIALGMGFWTSHYLFHFFTGALSLIPAFEHFFTYRGLPVDPHWTLARLALPSDWSFGITAGITVFYTFIAAYLSVRIALRDFGRRGVLAMWPMLLYSLAFGALALSVLAQPMEMRGTIFMQSF